ncbi:hypothetical protein PLESTB_000334200 [Pleodorina starrii]|uniref:TPX2 C-terminal domain-containing protein n=1 Tax=Pleodorina starrii TaxID=330485 RepID=A0A9W6EZE4_9CHLO|nr:hypothetical protein PLESTM_001883000 [Pleodorina starrii]GLC50026.1 hypothetical protein PLESTB_000334200 [Pleodorina starrii]GLC70494.1 hypothetical protein PLESTF_000987600 [Pleodorina starrii]
MSLGAALESREFLSSCLKAALDDADLVDAISDQALEQGFSALTIGQGKVSVDQLKDKLYLTVEEAKSVLNICTSMVAGAGSTKPSDPLALHLNATQSGNLAMHLSFKQQQQQDGAKLVPAVSVQSTQEPSVPFEPLDMIMENAAVVVVSRTTPYSSEKKILAASEPQPLPPPSPEPAPVVEEPASAQPSLEFTASTDDTATPAEAIASKPSATKQTIPKPAPAKPADVPLAPTPPKPDSTKPTDAPAAVTSPKPAAAAASPKPVAKPSPRQSMFAKPTEPLSPEASVYSPRLASATSCPTSSPSYLRPTAAHKARVSKIETEPINLAPVQEDSHEQRKRRTLFSRMASTLLAPTQAFVARVTGREEAKSKKDAGVTKMSLQLESMLTSPQGQRVTKPQPFMLRSEMRGKSVTMSTVELELALAREKAFKRNPVPKHVHESRPIVPTQRTAPKDPNEVFEPFQLASVELHNKKMEERRKKLEEEAARDEEARRFKARSFDTRIVASPVTPPKPPPSPVTKASAPVFASEARIQHYHEVVEPAKKAKEEAANQEKVEADRKAKELEEMNVDDFRKTLEFKARPMPDFSAPFRVDPALSRPVTSPSEPKLHTVARLGAVATREDKEGPGLGNGVYDGAGYVDPFSASLRKSTSFGLTRLSSGSKSMTPTSVRKSMLRSSTSASYNQQRPTSARGSVGSNLQAAIRAAARDAARDLAASGCPVSQLEECEEEEVCSAAAV